MTRSADDFDPWLPSDLVRFLRTYGALDGSQEDVCAADIQAALGISETAALATQRRVVALELLEKIEGVPHRLSDTAIDFPHRLTGEGVRAVLNDRLPDIQ